MPTRLPGSPRLTLASAAEGEAGRSRAGVGSLPTDSTRGERSWPSSHCKDEPTIGRLVSDASRDISSLIQKEIQLAKSELKVSVKNGGTGIGLFAGAVFFV